MINTVIKKNGIKYGIIIGIVLSLITTMMYSINLRLFVSGWIGGLSFLIFLIITSILLVKTKKDLNASFSFKDALTTYLIAILVGILISTFFDIILFNFIDPEAKDALGRLVAGYMAETMQKIGTPASIINETTAKIKESNPYSTLELLKAFIFRIVGYLLLGLIMAAFFKSKTPSQE